MAELSPVEIYRDSWVPNKATIAKLRRAIAKAQDKRQYVKATALTELMLAEMRPPQHLPIKRLTEVECPNE